MYILNFELICITVCHRIVEEDNDAMMDKTRMKYRYKHRQRKKMRR